MRINHQNTDSYVSGMTKSVVWDSDEPGPWSGRYREFFTLHREFFVRLPECLSNISFLFVGTTYAVLIEPVSEGIRLNP